MPSDNGQISAFDFNFPTMVMKNSVFWDTTLCSALSVDKREAIASRILVATRFTLISS
jgi:hypothetical protein